MGKRIKSRAIHFVYHLKLDKRERIRWSGAFWKCMFLCALFLSLSFIALFSIRDENKYSFSHENQ